MIKEELEGLEKITSTTWMEDLLENCRPVVYILKEVAEDSLIGIPGEIQKRKNPTDDAFTFFFRVKDI